MNDAGGTDGLADELTAQLPELRGKLKAGAVLAGLKLYGLLMFVSVLRVAGAPVVLFRTWNQSKSAKKRRPGKSSAA